MRDLGLFRGNRTWSVSFHSTFLLSIPMRFISRGFLYDYFLNKSRGFFFSANFHNGTSLLYISREGYFKQIGCRSLNHFPCGAFRVTFSYNFYWPFWLVYEILFWGSDRFYFRWRLPPKPVFIRCETGPRNGPSWPLWPTFSFCKFSI